MGPDKELSDKPCILIFIIVFDHLWIFPKSTDSPADFWHLSQIMQIWYFIKAQMKPREWICAFSHLRPLLLPLLSWEFFFFKFLVLLLFSWKRRRANLRSSNRGMKICFSTFSLLLLSQSCSSSAEICPSCSFPPFLAASRKKSPGETSQIHTGSLLSTSHPSNSWERATTKPTLPGPSWSLQFMGG